MTFNAFSSCAMALRHPNLTEDKRVDAAFDYSAGVIDRVNDTGLAYHADALVDDIGRTFLRVAENRGETPRLRQVAIDRGVTILSHVADHYIAQQDFTALTPQARYPQAIPYGLGNIFGTLAGKQLRREASTELGQFCAQLAGFSERLMILAMTARPGRDDKLQGEAVNGLGQVLAMADRAGMPLAADGYRAKLRKLEMLTNSEGLRRTIRAAGLDPK